MTKPININDSIREDLKKVDMMLRGAANLNGDSMQVVFNHFFKVQGKYLRPTLILLSAYTVNPNLTDEQIDKIIKLSVAVELIHSASLIHDDIIDGDLMRRGQKTLNNVYGKKTAVLAGDALYAKAFSILSKSLPREIENVITQVIESMCAAEITQAREIEISKQEYFQIIKGKTASFMSACCKLGAALAGADEKGMSNFERYGLNLGMIYQIVDDCIDKDSIALKYVTLKDAENLALESKRLLEFFNDSIYKTELVNLIEYILKL
ncbi:MAG: polyprenyl synthetase family protein [Solirubrobacterales bacterium]